MRHVFMFLLSVLAATPLLAQGLGSRGFSVHDRDGDNALSATEYAALREQCRAHRDARGRARCDPTRLLSFEMLDGDDDGRVTEAELVGALGARHRHGRAWDRQ